jgi:hypothetical protein
MSSFDSLNKQKAEHLKKYPSHTMLMNDHNGNYILICEDCVATWQNFDEEKTVPEEIPRPPNRSKIPPCNGPGGNPPPAKQAKTRPI